jgi:hypothetical protein
MAPYDPTGPAFAAAEGDLIADLSPAIETISPRPTLEPVGVVRTEQIELPPAVVAPETITPIPLPLRNVSGSYKGTSGTFELDLRVDVDGRRPLHRLSGDFFTTSGATQTYFGSFVVGSVSVTNTAAGEVITGLGTFTFAAADPVVQVTIPRRTLFQPAAAATVRFFTTGNAPGATYVCAYASAYFRSLTIQTEVVSDVTTPVFTSYDTGLLPSGGLARPLSVVTAYAEAGVQMSPVASGPVINVAEAGPDHLWSDAELLASMQRHFTHYSTAPHWDMWQAVCFEHEIGPTLYGIMFDSARRQGCAVFYDGIGGTTSDKLRLQLYTHVHELGHCFNLMHSWQKSLAQPPGVDVPTALSWMNYPWKYPTGPNAFWNAFPFQFVDEEVVHIRHAFRNTVIPSANPFTVGAEEIDPEVMADPVRDLSGLDFSIAPVQPTYQLSEPVVLKLQLRSFDRRGRVVHGNLHPNTSGVSIAIARPNGRVVRFEPLVDHLVAPELQLLSADGAINETAYIGYGSGGLYFDQPGIYKLRAIYHAPDGSRVLSNVAQVKVRYPVTAEENNIADLLLGDEQGALFALRGSDAPELADGNKAFDMMLSKYASHPLAAYVHLAKGTNAARTFKTIDHAAPYRLRVRPADLDNADALLTAASKAGRLDDISKAKGLERLAKAQALTGDSTLATQTRQVAQQLRSSYRH